MSDRRWQSRLPVALAMLGVVAAFYVLREHWGHLLGVAPYLLLLACPLMHLLHGHPSHGRSAADARQHDAAAGSDPSTRT